MKYFLVFLLLAIGGITRYEVQGEALMCQECMAVNAEDCSGESVECKNENDKCAKSIEYNTVRGERIPSFSRGCMNLTIMCDSLFTLTTPDFTLEIYNECCDSDDCNVGGIEVPKKNTTKNGLSCKVCYEEGTYKCAKYETMECTGNEGDCLEFNGDAKRPGLEEEKYALAGCATKGACVIGFDALVGTVPGKLRELDCPDQNRILE